MSDDLKARVKNVMSGVYARMDAWANSVTALGGIRDKTTQNFIQAPRYWPPALLEFLYMGDDLAATIVEALPEQAFMKGFSVAEDEEGEIAKALEHWEILDKVLEASIWGRVFGFGAILIGTDTNRMDEPLDLEKMQPGDLKYLMTLDCRDVTIAERYKDPSGEKYNEPKLYRVTKNQATFGTAIHESRIILFGGARTSDRQRNLNSGVDFSILHRVINTLRDADTNWRSSVYMLSDASQAVFKIKGLVDMIAEGDVTSMQTRMAVTNEARSLARAVVVDAEYESFEQVGVANLAGVPEMLDRTWQKLAAAARMPVTVLMGTSPAGMNATGASDLELWHGRIQAFQTRVLTPALSRLVQVVTLNEGISLDSEMPTIEFPPLRQESPSEKATTRKLVADTDKIYMDSGVLLPEEVAKGRWGQGHYSPDMVHAVELEGREKILEDELAAMLEDDPDPPPAPVETPPAGAPPLPPNSEEE